MLSLPDDILLQVGNFVEDHWDRYKSASLKSCSQTQTFLNALILRPELARAVRCLDFENWQPKLPSHACSIKENLTPTSDWVRSLCNSEDEHAQWEQDLLSGEEEAWIALLLPLVNNIRQLRLVYPRNNRYLDRTLQRVVAGEKRCYEQPAFHALREVHLSHLVDDEDTKGSFVPAQIMPFFQLPSVRIFSADSVVESRPTQEDGQRHAQAPEVTATACSSISEITFNSSSGAQGMETLLASGSPLKSFKYQHSDAHVQSEGYRPSSFRQSLARSRATLQTLWLDTCGEHLPFTIAGINETHDEWFGPLVDFTALKELRIRLPNLLDVRYQPEPSSPLTEILPRSVESIYVEGCKENSLGILIQQLQQLVLSEHKQRRFPGLQRLDIEGFFHDDDDDDDEGASGPAGSGEKHEKVIKPRVYAMVEPLQQVCSDLGIRLFLRDRVCLQTMFGG